MGSINRQLLLGTVATDAVGRSMPGGGMVANFRLKTVEEVDRNGEKKEFAEFHNVVVYGPKAESAREFKQGEEVYVEGRTKTRKYQHDGQDRYITEVVAFTVFRTGEQAGGQRPSAAASRAPASTSNAGGEPPAAWDDDQPF